MPLDLRTTVERWADEALARLMSRSVVAASGCREWQGASRPVGGYGRLSFKGQMWNAHRLMWTVMRGAIPDGLYVCHACDNKGCIEIDHLWLGTHTENLQDAARKGLIVGANLAKTHCPHGHPYDDGNTYLSKQGWRKCRECALKAEKRRYRERKQLADA